MPERAYSPGDQAAAPRSLHFIPATLLQDMDPARLATIGADSVVLDLEDSVRPEDRTQAREWLANFIHDGHVPDGVDACVRINMPGSEWWDDDLEAFDGVAPLMIPKIYRLQDIPAATRSEVIPILETLPGVDFMPGLTAMNDAGSGPKIATVIFGKEDLLIELGHINTDPDSANPIPSADLRLNPLLRELFSYIRWGTSHDLRIIDGVTKRLVWDEPSMRDFEAECAYAQRIGAAGKLSVHTAQVDTINGIFRASADLVVEPQPGAKPELEQDISSVPNLDAKLRNAERIIQAFETNQRAQNIATVEIDGLKTMVGPPAYQLAQAILAVDRQ